MNYLIVCIWVICGVAHYPLFKKFMTNGGLTWTVGDRRMAIFLGLLGPVALLVSIIASNIENRNPAKW